MQNKERLALENAGIAIRVSDIVSPNEVWLVETTGHELSETWDGERLRISITEAFRILGRIPLARGSDR